MSKQSELNLNKELDSIISSCRDIEETNKVWRAYNIGIKKLASKLDIIWIIVAKIDKVYSEIIEKKYGA